MPLRELSFDHIHLVSENPREAATWYVNVFDAEVVAEYELREAPQINVQLAGMTLLIRGRRPGEEPIFPTPMKHFDRYSSHDVWGTDHFGLAYHGDLRSFCDEIKQRGATLTVEPWEFSPGALICYVGAPDGVSIEVVEAKRK
ncbi:MAG: VOC family protein [Pseudomonadota bacterium]|nr:VOC family protein [Pseudomonadota bacterium]